MVGLYRSLKEYFGGKDYANNHLIFVCVQVIMPKLRDFMELCVQHFFYTNTTLLLRNGGDPNTTDFYFSHYTRCYPKVRGI
jgi:hypothetical protein